VHQIYGLFGDDKPMSNLFQTSNKMWKEVAAGMGAQYHLWNAAEVESLVKQRYPQFWDMYCGVRYPIMRADIGRLAVLHNYGGLYADLDIMPNRTWYAQAALAVPRVQVLPARPSAKTTRQSGTVRTYLEMEVIVGAKGNPMFIDWLTHIRKEIACKSYARKESFWYHAKMRYVYNTTGPRSMARFLKLPANVEHVKSLKFLECNHFKEAKDLTQMQRRYFDVISHESNSYFTDAHEIKVPVGPADESLPTLPMAKRMRVTAPSQEMKEHDAANGRDPSDGSQTGACSSELDALKVETQRLQAEVSAYRDRESALRKQFRKYKNSTATQTVLQDMPKDLRHWLTHERSKD
jgi:hypothetical protein